MPPDPDEADRTMAEVIGGIRASIDEDIADGIDHGAQARYDAEPTVVRSAPRADIWTKSIAVAAVLLALLFGYLGSRSRDDMADDLAVSNAGNAALAQDVNELRDQYEQITGRESPVPPAAETLENAETIARGERGAEGAAGIQGEQGEQGIQGPPGPEGKQGPAGPVGEKGAPGANGADGVDGQDGAAGADGTPGANGADGRGIASQDCVSGDLVTTYTDGTTSTIADSPACPQGDPSPPGGGLLP